jgi:hypothetical protein
MAKKRFIQPNWRVLGKLSAELFKCYFYCWNKADDAGVYELDIEYMQADLKFHLSFEELLKLPGVKKIGEAKLLFTDFLHVNYNGILKAGYNPHKPIFRAIEFHGAENFADLDVMIESGVKEDKKIQAIKYFFKLENIFSSLLNGDVNENGDGDKKGEGVGEEKGNQVGITHDMKADYKKFFPKYADEDKDMPALLSLAYKIGNQLNISKHDVVNGSGHLVRTRWGEMLPMIATDKWYSKKSISFLDNDFTGLNQAFEASKNLINGTHKQGAGKGQSIGRDIVFDEP